MTEQPPTGQIAPILIVTATKVEALAVLKAFSAKVSSSRYIIGNKTYYTLGECGGAPVFMVQSEMGTATPGGALLTVRQAIQDLQPQAIVMCGIAYGLHPDKQRMGDILIARQLHYYEPQKVDIQRGQMPRGDRVTTTGRLLDRCRSVDLDWKGAKTHFGLVLSGEKLVNNPIFRDWLVENEPEAIGGEMEGTGLYVAARDANVDWIIVKAICDWADGTKNDKSQKLAARNAAQFVRQVLGLGGWDKNKHKGSGSIQPKMSSGIRQLEAAMPAKSQVNKQTEVRVMVSLSDSEGLRHYLPDYTSAGELIAKKDVKKNLVPIEFPIDSATHGILPLELVVSITALDFILEQPERTIRIFPDRNSGVVTFLLIPTRRHERGRVVVELFSDMQHSILYGSLTLITEIKSLQDTITNAIWQLASFPILFAVSGWGDEVHGDKVRGNKVEVGPITGTSGPVIIGSNIQITQVAPASVEQRNASPDTKVSPPDSASVPISARKLWLDNLGFFIDPFEHLNGARDPNILRYFYRIPSFYEIVGDGDRLGPIFVFGSEGSGKSSLGNAVERMARSMSVLPVVYRSLKPLTRLPEPVQRKDHIARLIEATLKVLVEEIDREIGLAQMALNASKIDIRNYIYAYATQYTSAAFTRHRLRNILNPSEAEPDLLPVDECDLLGSLCEEICHLFGYQAVYYLVDPDPLIVPASPNALWDVIRPLIESSDLLDLPNTRMAFKFFLEDSLRERVLSIPWIARQREIIVHTLLWTPDTLKALLQERLRQSSGTRPPITSLGSISEVANLDERVIQLSYGSPRRLITICNRLFKEHIAPPFDASRKVITRDEVERALTSYPSANRLNPARIVDGTYPLDELALHQLITQGESQFFEMKETLRFNIESGRSDNVLGQALAQEICSFLNSNGGLILIGVSDRGEVMGLERDINILTKGRNNEDGLRLTITDIISQKLKHAHEGIRISFEDFQGKRVCAIIVPKSSEPAYYVNENRRTEFYYRLENSKRQLDIEEAVQYISRHFERH